MKKKKKTREMYLRSRIWLVDWVRRILIAGDERMEFEDLKPYEIALMEK